MIQQKTHPSAKYSILDLDQAGHGGLNIQDLDYTMNLSQSPKMLNMMIKNGVFGKRYGQKLVHTFNGEIKAMGKYHDALFVHIGNSLIKYKNGSETTVYTSDKLDTAGTFINYNKNLYYLTPKVYLTFNNETCKPVEPYCPDVLINRKPDGSYAGDTIDDYNRLGAGFKNTFSSDGVSTVYKLSIPKDDDNDTRGLDDTPLKITVDTSDYTEGNQFTCDHKTGEITFKTAPNKGTNNVVVTAYKTSQKYVDSIMNCKYWAVYGGQNNSRLFLAGEGSATYFFTEVFDGSYFPENNYAVVGNAEEDITGFGAQYNVLVVFKKSEMYMVSYNYVQDKDGNMKAEFYSSPINVEMGCDVPRSIHYVDNRLTWVHTQWGVCTLCSTVIQDERNVRVISRNINGGYRTDGLINEPNLDKAIAMNYEGKYIVCVNGNAYAWDYTNAPYTTSERITPDQAAGQLAWYLWDNINVTSYKFMPDRKMYYTHGADLCIFTDELDDFGKAINAYYQTPMLDFGRYEMLKTVKKAFIEVRADVPTIIKISYLTDENPNGETDPEDIIVGATLWDDFRWTTFAWSAHAFAKTFARKCSVKKVCLFGILLENNMVHRDLTISGIRLEYTAVKEIK